MPANAVEGAARALKGAVKRWYNHANATLTSGGSANAQTLTYAVAPSAYVTGDAYAFKAGFTNTGPMTLNSGPGVKAVQSQGAALVGNEVVLNRVALVYYDGVNFQLVNSQILGIQTGSAAGGDLSGTYPNPTVTGTHLSASLPIAQGGTGQSTALAAFNALVASAASIAPSGYIQLKNGLMIQWGAASFSAAASAAVTFPVPFPTSFYGAVMSTSDNGAATGVGASSLSGFTFGLSKSTTGTGFYIAFGN